MGQAEQGAPSIKNRALCAKGVFCRARFFSSRTASLVHSRRFDVLAISLPNFCFGNRRSISLKRSCSRTRLPSRQGWRTLRPKLCFGLRQSERVAATNSSTPMLSPCAGDPDQLWFPLRVAAAGRARDAGERLMDASGRLTERLSAGDTMRVNTWSARPVNNIGPSAHTARPVRYAAPVVLLLETGSAQPFPP
jgi:hypothetical protein